MTNLLGYQDTTDATFTFERYCVGLLARAAAAYKGATYQGHTEMIEDCFRYCRDGEASRTSYVPADEPCNVDLIANHVMFV